MGRLIDVDDLMQYAFGHRKGLIHTADIDKIPSAQPERWDTCFSCPLSHGCPVIKGCTNDQAEQYAGEIPTDCPLDKESAQTERPKGEWIDYTEDGYVECPFCHSATNCDGNKDELHFCFSCGADMRGEQDDSV